MRLAVLAAVAALLLPACAAPYDDDGEVFVGGSLSAAPAKTARPVPVVVDSDLAPDDLVAISYLVRHPDVDVRAISVPATGMVTCPAGVDLLGDLFAAIGAEPVPVVCGRTERGAHGIPFPAWWTVASLTRSGLDRSLPTADVPTAATSAAAYLARLADRLDGLHVVALGPLTEVARVATRHPGSYARLAGVVTMAGIVDETSQDPELGVGEWNAAADPEALATVLEGPVPVTVVPHDPVPHGRPAGLAAPVVSMLGMHQEFLSPAYWDTATAAVFTVPEVAAFETGTWAVDVMHDRGRLRRTGPGTVRVVVGLAEERLDGAYRRVFGG